MSDALAAVAVPFWLVDFAFALRVFDEAPVADEYTVMNVTDTQVSVGSQYQDKTQTHLDEHRELHGRALSPARPPGRAPGQSESDRPVMCS